MERDTPEPKNPFQSGQKMFRGLSTGPSTGPSWPDAENQPKRLTMGEQNIKIEIKKRKSSH